MKENPQLVNSAAGASTSDGVHRDNGGPKIQKLTSDTKLDRIRELVNRLDISAAQKCIGIGIVVDADEDGVTPELSTDDLKRFAAVKDRKTVYRATQKLDEKKIARTVKEDGRANRYLLLQAEAIDAALDDIEATSANQRHREMPKNGTTQCQETAPSPVPKNGTGPTGEDGFDGTGAVQRHGTAPFHADATSHAYYKESHATNESPSEISISKKKSASPPTSEGLIVNCETIRGPGFVIDLNAVDIEASLRGIPTAFARSKAEAMARQWASSGKVPQNPDASVARALREEANSAAVHDVKISQARSYAPKKQVLF